LGGTAKIIRSRVAAVRPVESAHNFVVGAVFVVRNISEEFAVHIAAVQVVAKVSSSHSYQITIKELMIVLSLHGQNTPALQLKVSGQAILKKLTRKDFFVKQADTITLPNSLKEISI